MSPVTNHIEQIIKVTPKRKNHILFHKNHCKTKVKCKKCLDDQQKRGIPSASFDNTASLTKHTLSVHQNEKNISPTFFDVFLVLEKIATALEKKIPINTIPEVVEWKIEVK